MYGTRDGLSFDELNEKGSKKRERNVVQGN
jgi:hypothetical protein